LSNKKFVFEDDFKTKIKARLCNDYPKAVLKPGKRNDASLEFNVAELIDEKNGHIVQIDANTFVMRAQRHKDPKAEHAVISRPQARKRAEWHRVSSLREAEGFCSNYITLHGRFDLDGLLRSSELSCSYLFVLFGFQSFIVIGFQFVLLPALSFGKLYFCCGL